GLRQGAIRRNQKPLQALLPGAGVTQLADLVADQLLDGRAGQRGDRGARLPQQRGDLPVGQVRDAGQVVLGGGPEPRGGGVAVEQLEDPARRQVLDEQGQLGEGQGQQVVQLVDQAGALPYRGLQPRGDLTQGAQRRGEDRCRPRPFAEGEAGAGACLDGVG